MSTGEETLESMREAEGYNSWLLKKFAQFLSGDILEVGVGIGNFTEIILRYGQVWGIDIESTYIKKAKDRFKGNVQIGYGDIELGKFFFKHQFNSIICLNVLEHINNDKRALSNLFKLLKPKGYLILLVPAHQILYGQIDQSIGHYRRYNEVELRDKLRLSGFKVVAISQLNLLGAIGWYLSGKIIRNNVVTKGKIRIFNIFSPIFLFIEDLIGTPFGISYLCICQK